MKRKKNSECHFDHTTVSVREAADTLQLKLPDAYQDRSSMALLAREIKRQERAPFCVLPFCHTLEAEAMGGQIRLGNEMAGPRGGAYIAKSVQELLELPSIDYKKGRIREVLAAARILREQGEQVVLQISGPFTIMSVLIDLKYVFKMLRKEPEMITNLYRKFQTELTAYIKEACDCGIEFISYADPAAGEDILGPIMASQVAEGFTHPFLNRAEAVMKNKALMILCPKTSGILCETKRAESFPIVLPKPVTYGEACMKALGKAAFTGQVCMKNPSCELKDGVLKGIRLRDHSERL